MEITFIFIKSNGHFTGDKVATRQAYGTALSKLAENNKRVIALDGDTKNSTFSNAMLKTDPSRYV